IPRTKDQREAIHEPGGRKTGPCTRAEDGVSPIKPSPFQDRCISITTKDDSGGLEVILDVYFPLHL
ncbi:hypothetical protein U9M48_014887, partial [Paspalum notatum var. saurae]